MFAFYEKNYTLRTKKCQPARKIFLFCAKNGDGGRRKRGDGNFLRGFLEEIVFCKKFTIGLSPRAIIRPVCP